MHESPFKHAFTKRELQFSCRSESSKLKLGRIRVDLEEVVEKNAEFENFDYLKKIIESQCPTSLLSVHLCYRLQT